MNPTCNALASTNEGERGRHPAVRTKAEKRQRRKTKDGRDATTTRCVHVNTASPASNPDTLTLPPTNQDSTSSRQNIKINGNHITQVTRHRHLGVTFNERLSWKDHVHDVIQKSAKKIRLLHRLGRQLSSTVVRDLYAFSIRPGIEYGSIVWSGLSSSDAARLERLNRSAARLVTKTSASSDLSRELLLARAGLPSLGTRRRMAQCMLIRKAYLGRHPRHLQRALSPWISPGKRRQSPRTSPLSIHAQRPNKSFFQRSPLFQAATTWNRFVVATASRDLPSARNISNFFEQ